MTHQHNDVPNDVFEQYRTHI